MSGDLRRVNNDKAVGQRHDLEGTASQQFFFPGMNRCLFFSLKERSYNGYHMCSLSSWEDDRAPWFVCWFVSRDAKALVVWKLDHLNIFCTFGG